ncbi:MAG: carboxypeptidase-like regulatory domain-containing protein [Solirubrobacteraceae bacterium]
MQPTGRRQLRSARARANGERPEDLTLVRALGRWPAADLPVVRRHASASSGGGVGVVTSIASAGRFCRYFLLAMVGAACAALPTTPGAVSGVVRDTAGASIRYAQVWIPGTGIRAYADSLGRYRLDSVPAGRVQLRAALVGYRTEEHRSVLVTAGHSTPVDFVLRIPGACDVDCHPLVVPATPGRDSTGPEKP